jgi:hypothetical protein
MNRTLIRARGGKGALGLRRREYLHPRVRTLGVAGVLYDQERFLQVELTLTCLIGVDGCVLDHPGKGAGLRERKVA